MFASQPSEHLQAKRANLESLWNILNYFSRATPDCAEIAGKQNNSTTLIIPEKDKYPNPHILCMFQKIFMNINTFILETLPIHEYLNYSLVCAHSFHSK